MRKVTWLKDIEKSIQQNANYQVEIDYTKPKFMATFPYPYMNGKLHLGHAFTMGKVDFECRWKQLNGYNVLFPFGFHCTGMPICASAKKLEKELDSGNIPDPADKSAQYNIMLSSGIDPGEIPKFIDPTYWVKYFPTLGLSHIKKLGIMADTTRSFVTTDVNPFYDSFINWQFVKLHRAGYLKFGTRNSIYSELLGIQCQDHDRTQGEGIQNLDFAIAQVQIENDTFLWIPYEENFENKDKLINSISVSPNTKFALYTNEENHVQVYMTEYVYKNYTYQFSDNKLKFVKSGYTMEFPGLTPIKKYSNEYSDYLGGQVTFSSNNSEEFLDSVSICDFKINMSTELVVDRMGGICYVKPMDQWFIDYSNSEWKKKAHECVNQMKLSDKARASLSHTINWLKEWGVSRPFGLGTKLPTDPAFVIDSLSDSTIYPAYYTIANQLHEDIYGKQSKFNPDDFTFDVWEYIFVRGPYKPEFAIVESELKKMRESFEYFYPVDIRVSGKDLLTNHLGMYIFNHVALFKQSHWPVGINCNGWVLVNGEKMSKSKGNFITIESATDINSVDAVRLTLADSGDNMDDANYITANAGDHSTLKLYSWIESVEKIIGDRDNFSNHLTEFDKMASSVFACQITKVVEHYNTYTYRNVIRDGFHGFNGLREKYRIYSKYLGQQVSWSVIITSIKIQLLLMYPIVPHVVQHIWKNILKEQEPITSNNISQMEFNFTQDDIDTWEQVETIVNDLRIRIEKHKKRNPTINKIIIGTKQISPIGVQLIQAQIKYQLEFTFDDTMTKLTFKFE